MTIPRQHAQPAVLEIGFRPFFLLAGLWAVLAMAGWLMMVRGVFTLPTAFGQTTWHAHEMLFGYVAAVMTGFVLTAIPNWTGRVPLQGTPLAWLAALWAAGRLAVAFSASIGVVIAAIIDVAFLAMVIAIVVREIVAGRNWRNLPVVILFAVALLANILIHAGSLGAPEMGALGLRLAIAIILVLITLIGGRIVPSFTGNWLRQRNAQHLPIEFGRYDLVTLSITVLALAAWVGAPDNGGANGLMLVAAALQAIRLGRWRGWATLRQPLVWVLHLGYAWVPVGLALVGLAHWTPALEGGAALHALTAGAMGTMTLAVMTRATLGHTGRELTAGPATTAAYLLLTLSVLARIAASVFSATSVPLLGASAALWIAAFTLYLLVYAPMQTRQRIG
jgi:uncharacterized protein involved in response to NO